MTRPLKRGGSASQLTLLLPISSKPSLRTKVVVVDKLKIAESRKRLLKDLEGTGLRSPK